MHHEGRDSDDIAFARLDLFRPCIGEPPDRQCTFDDPKDFRACMGVARRLAAGLDRHVEDVKPVACQASPSLDLVAQHEEAFCLRTGICFHK